jgi:hypothetical protein
MMTWLDYHTSVEWWNSEEVVVRYLSPIDKMPHRYFPDYLVKLLNDNKIYMVEVKPKKETCPPKPSKNKRKLLKEALTYAKNSAKWDAARAYCAERGWKFLIMTEDNIYGRKQ